MLPLEVVCAEDERDLGAGGNGAVIVPGVHCRAALHMIYNCTMQLRTEIVSQTSLPELMYQLMVALGRAFRTEQFMVSRFPIFTL